MKLMPQEIISHKRDGLALSQAEVEQFVSGVVSGDFKDYQSSALLMAILLSLVLCNSLVRLVAMA